MLDEGAGTRSALELARARAQAEALREALGPTAQIVGTSPQIAETAG